MEFLLECNDTSTHFAWTGADDGFIFRLPIPLALSGLVINSIFIALLIYGQWSGELNGHVYRFLLNRALGDTVTAGSILFFQVSIKRQLFALKFSLLSLVATSSASFIASTGSYLSLSTFKLISIKWPFYYRIHVTKALAIMILIGTWLFAISSSMVQLTLLLSYFGTVPIFKCDKSSSSSGDLCIRVSQFLIGSTSLTILLAVIVTYCFTFASVYKAMKNAPRNSHSHRVICRSAAICVLRLGLNVSTYALMCSLEAPATLLILSLAPLILTSQNTVTGIECPPLAVSSAAVDYWQWTIFCATILHNVLLLRIVLDPIINCIIGRRMGRQIRNMIPFCDRLLSNANSSFGLLNRKSTKQTLVMAETMEGLTSENGRQTTSDQL